VQLEINEVIGIVKNNTLQARWCRGLVAFGSSCVLLWTGAASSQTTPPIRNISSQKARFRVKGPEQLILGKEASATVVLEGQSPRPLRWYTNIGEITESRDGPNGRLKQIYLPPRNTKYPQIAIIAAVSDDGSAFAWTSIALIGSASVKIETKPRAEIKLRVGKVDYGPFKSDTHGIARINVLVPPGISQATSFVTDTLGNTGGSPVDLGVPATNRLLAVCPPEGHRFLFFAMDKEASPLRKGKIDIQTAKVAAGALEQLSDGVFTSSIEVPDGISAGERATLKAALVDDPASVARCTMGVPLELPDQIAVGLSPKAIRAGYEKPVAVTVTLRYPGKRKPGRVPVELSPDMGRVDDVTLVSDTTYQAHWTVPHSFAGKNRAMIEANVPVARTLKGNASLSLRAGPVTRLTVVAPDTKLAADGRSTAPISAKALDDYGNSVLSGIRLTGTARFGALGPFEKRADGSFVARYTAPSGDRSEDDRLVISVIEGDRNTGVAASCPVGLAAQGPSWMVALRLGYLSNFGLVSAPLFLASVEHPLSFIDNNLLVGAEGGYYGDSTARFNDTHHEKIDTSVTAFPLLARIVYQRRLAPAVVYPGLGAGVLFTKIKVTSPNTGISDVVQANLLLAGFLGASIKAGPGRALAEFGYWYSRIEKEWIKGSLIGGFHGTVGYELEF
jgi:hypothetical protein